MTLGSDRRGRVPFALVGVVLLLGSVTYGHTLAVAGPVTEDRSVDDAVDRAESAVRPALRVAAARAARAAARTPVTDPSETAVGAALDPEQPFRDALRLRIAVRAADALEQVSVRTGGVDVTASLPRLEGPADVRIAIERVSVDGVNNGTGLRVTVRNVSLTAHRNGRVVATDRETYTVTVGVPVLAMHQRVQRYERRLNADPFRPGLGRALTWRLTAVAEARGLAQWGGAPVENVLSNRHVELSTNAAALRAQRAAFGRADPDGRAALLRATARVGATDLLAASRTRQAGWTDTVLSVSDAARQPDSGVGARFASVNGSADGASVPDSFTVGVNRTADTAFVTLLEGRFDEVLAASYRAEVTRRVRVVSATRGVRPTPDDPGANWTLVGEQRHRSAAVVDRDAASDASDPASFLAADRSVVVDHVVVRTWSNGSATRTTRGDWTDRYRVRVTVRGTYRPSVPGPSRTTSPVFRAGGALDGPNLADIERRARDRFAPSSAAVDRLAKRATRRGASTTTATVQGSRPASLRDWVYRDVARLRDRVRAVTTTVSRSELAAGRANAAAELAAALRARRTELLDAPATYDGAADRARVAARAAYLDAVVEALDQRSATAADRNGAFRSVLRDAGVDVDAAGRLAALSRTAADATAPAPRPAGRWLDRPVVLTPHGDPGYLTLTAVDAAQASSVTPGTTVHPLAARNTNVFTLPTGDASDTVASAVFPARRTARFRVGARALRSANRTLAAAPNRTLRRHRDALLVAVTESMRGVDDRADAVLRRRTQLTRSERRAAVEATKHRWPAVGVRAVAATNGSYANVVAAAAAEDEALSGVESDRLAVALRVVVADEVTSRRVAVPRGMTNATVTETRSVRHALVAAAVRKAGERGVAAVRERYVNETFAGVLAGLPVAPIPGYWYATVNVWDVEVRGVYPRFSVTASTGGPLGSGAGARYVRDGSVAALDVDGDGDAERLGRAERVSFRTRTAVFVVVPAGKSGVGDVDGNADERSAGWPCPSPTATAACPANSNVGG
ncbi:DUF7286 family protein [Halobaculum sp. P14]|uniref:DUF7286 family protein n=1 Tax=Halobaculum sp. P14 TaxID=3421638 RepID=UPI003EBEBDC7